jgi:hypothetical protein
MKLISDYFGPYHVSLDVVKEFEKSILMDPRVDSPVSFGQLVSKTSYYAWRMWNQFGSNIARASRMYSRRSSVNESYFTVLMGPNFPKCFPYFYFRGQKSLYLFDAWPQYHEMIEKFFDVFDVSFAFLSSSQVADRLQSMSRKTKCYWIPEGVDTTQYRFYPYEKKDIDVLALGRKYDAYHVQIAPMLANNHRTYLYERVKGEIIFPTREEFIDGVARSKISICVPSSITHPTRAGNIQTMTVRYLQSMVSKCLIVGHAPEEMIRLFGYNPVIEIEMQDPGKQLRSILRDYGDYVSLIEKNYCAVMEEHTWRKRWTQITGVMSMT